MKAAIIAIVGVMAMTGPVFANEGEKINYPINFVNSEKGKDQVLKEFRMYDIKDSIKYKNDTFKTPKLYIIESEGNNFYKKAK
jgi:hypothetical protein